MHFLLYWGISLVSVPLQLSDEHSPVPKSAVAIFNSKSRDKSPDSILTSDDSSDSDQ